MISTTIAESASSQESSLQDLIHRRVGNRVRNLRVLFQPDGLVLQGRAATFHAKQVAQHAAMELASMPLLANDIEVR